MNASLPMNYRLNAAPVNRPTIRSNAIQTILHSVLSLFAAQDDPAALRYMLTKNGETVD